MLYQLTARVSLPPRNGKRQYDRAIALFKSFEEAYWALQALQNMIGDRLVVRQMWYQFGFTPRHIESLLWLSDEIVKVADETVKVDYAQC